MKKILPLLLILCLSVPKLYAQNVGVGNTSPNSKLDVSGDLALREGTAITVSGGNNIITLPSAKNSVYRLTGATAAFTVNAISAGNDGMVLTLINATGQIMTVRDSTSIRTNTNANLAGSTTVSSVTIVYNATLAKWIVVSGEGFSNSNGWNLTGNAGTTSSNFIGTTDNNPLYFKTNGAVVGYIPSSSNLSGNTGFGVGNGTPGGSYNVFMGFHTLSAGNTGNDNVTMGWNTLDVNTTGSDNIGLGWQPLAYNTTGSSNVALGSGVLEFNKTGSNNIGVGPGSLENDTTGGSNVAIGDNTLHILYNGSNNTVLGNGAGSSSTGSANVFLGNNAGANELTSNKLYIANSNTSTPLLYGDFTNQHLTVNDSLTAQYFQMTHGAALGDVLLSDANGNGAWVSPASVLLAFGHGTQNYVTKWNNVTGTTIGNSLIYDNGTNVGIGTTSPGQQLEVNGNIVAGASASTRVQLNGAGGTNAISETYQSESQPRWAIGRDLFSSGHAGIAFGPGDISALDLYIGRSTNGDMQFQTGGNGNNRMTILSAGNVGIGTTAPDTSLQVVGKTQTTYLQVTNGATSGYLLQSDASGNGSWVNPATVLLTFGHGTQNYVTKWNNVTGTTIGNSLIYDNGTDVGIATATPQNKLDVSGSVAVGSYAGTNAAPSNGLIVSGNVGIGTASPAYALDVNGQIRATANAGGSGAAYVASTPGSNVANAWDVTSGTTDQKWWDFIAYSTIFGGRAVNDANTLNNYWILVNRGSGYNISSVTFPNGHVGIGTSSPAQLLDVNGTSKTINFQMTNGAAAGYILQSDASGNASWVSPSSIAATNIYNSDGSLTGARTVTIGSSNLSFVSSGAYILLDPTASGRTGIGTASPISLFANTPTNILGSDGHGIVTNGLTWSVNAGGYAAAIYNAQSAPSADGLAVQIAGTSSNNRILDLSTSATQGVTGTTVMAVLGTGNVGIGTGSPQQMLSVNTGMNIDQAGGNTGTVSSNALTFGNGSGEGIASNRNSGANANGLDFYTAYTNRLAITNGGNVGIGTTSPGSTLTVNGTTSTTNFQMTNGGTANYILQSDASGNGTWVSPSSISANNIYNSDGTLSGNRTVAMGNDNLYFTTTGGRVGIGNTSPGATVDVTGNMSVGNSNTNSGTNTLIAGNNNTISSGQGAAVFGSFNTSSQDHVAVFGDHNVASGLNSLVAGYLDTVSGYHSMAMGDNNNVSAGLSMAAGSNNKVTGSGYDIASGQGNTVTSGSSAVFGEYNTLSGDNSTVSGSYNTVSGTNSLVAGIANTQTAGDGALITGGNNTGSADHVVIFGDHNIASANNGVVGGYEDTVSGIHAVAMGQNNHASGTQSAVFGSSNTAAGSNALAAGYNNNAPSYNEVTLGMNASTYTASSPGSYAPTDRIFDVGNGSSSSAPSDAMTILKNGNVGIGNNSPTKTLQVNGTTSTANFQMTNGGTANYLLQSDASGNGTWVAPSSIAANNIYNANGTLTANRTVTQGADNITFSSTTGNFVYTTNNVTGGGVALGYNNTISSTNNVAIGSGNTASAAYSSAIGFANAASGQYSMAMGSNSTASGKGAFTNGYGLTAASYYETALGTSNTTYTPASTTTWSATDRLFGIGNGSSPGSPSDAFVILKNGNTGVGTASPSSTLQVNGKTTTTTFEMTNGATANYILQSDASGNGTWVAPSSIGITNTKTWTQSGGLTDVVNSVSANVTPASGTITNILGYNSSGAPVYQAIAGLTESVSNNVSGNTISTTVDGTTGTAVTIPNIYTSNGTLTGARTVTMSGNTLNFTGGDVGIGTASTNASFNVNGNAVIGTGLINRAGSGLTVDYSNATTYAANTDATDAARALSIVNENSAASSMAILSLRSNANGGANNQMMDMKLVNPNNGTSSLIYSFGPNATFTDRFTMTSAGYLGIGTTAPQSQLANTATNIIGQDGQGVNTNSLTWAMSGQTGYVGAFYNANSGASGNGLAVKVAGTASTDRILDLSTGAQTTAGTSVMVALGNGNVGIGTSSPVQTLTTQYASGLWSGIETANHGFATQTGTSTSDYILYEGADKTNGLSYIQSVRYGTSVANLGLNTRGGNVGIGTGNSGTYYAPTNTLSINGSGGMWNYNEFSFYADNGSTQRGFIGNYGNGSDFALAATTSNWMRIGANNSSISFFPDGTITSANNPMVKINPQSSSSTSVGSGTYAVLEVWGVAGSPISSSATGENQAHTQYGWLATNGTNTSSVNSRAYSLYTWGSIWCNGEVDATSDERIKDVLDTSDNARDLAAVNKLNVVDYQYIDKQSHGDTKVKGFLAQQVETVFPDAVKTQPGVIPNIYRDADIVHYDATSKKLTVTMGTDHGLVAGDKVQIKAEGEDKNVVVSEVIDSKTFVVEGWEKDSHHVFVFGKEVPDLRNIDYNKIFSAGISAIQELSKKEQQLETENETLKASNEKLEKAMSAKADASQIEKLEAEIEALQQIVGAKAQK